VIISIDACAMKITHCIMKLSTVFIKIDSVILKINPFILNLDPVILSLDPVILNLDPVILNLFQDLVCSAIPKVQDSPRRIHTCKVKNTFASGINTFYRVKRMDINRVEEVVM